jgi:tetratricopeptide (TPR) repeat protein
MAMVALAFSATAGWAQQRPANLLLEDAIRARGLDPDTIIVPFEVSEPMRAWALNNVPRYTGRATDRLDALLSALLREHGGINLEYEGRVSRPAQEVFETGKANCLGFTMLFVGLSRSLGINTYFLLVDDLVTAQQEGDLVVLSGHVTSAFGPPSERTVLDFAVAPVREYRNVGPINDLTAIALYYSNRGAEELRDGDPEKAREWLEVATKLDPELDDPWINLGVALRRLGDYPAAERAYRTALEIDASASSAYHNLAALLRRSNRIDEADELLTLAKSLNSRNPFNFVSLGDMALRRGNHDEAARYYRRAIRLAPDDAYGYAALGRLELAAGDERQARSLLKKARKKNPEDLRVHLLETLLEHGSSPLDVTTQVATAQPAAAPTVVSKMAFFGK